MDYDNFKRELISPFMKFLNFNIQLCQGVIMENEISVVCIHCKRKFRAEKNKLKEIENGHKKGHHEDYLSSEPDKYLEVECPYCEWLNYIDE